MLQKLMQNSWKFIDLFRPASWNVTFSIMSSNTLNTLYAEFGKLDLDSYVQRFLEIVVS